MNARRTIQSIGLLLALFSAAAAAEDGQRFLEQVTSQVRAGQLVVTVQLVADLDYLSHSPPELGRSVEIRFGTSVRAQGQLAVAGAADPGLQRIDPAAVTQIERVETIGHLDASPGLIVHFDQERAFDVRPGRDGRSIEITFIDAAAATPTLEAPVEAVPAGATAEEQRLAGLFRRARLAYGAGELQRTTALYEQIIDGRIEPYVREATLALATLRMERGQDAHAIALLERYLEDYPEGPGARYAASLHASLLAAPTTGGGDDPVGEAETALAAIEWFGAVEQFYLHDYVDLDGQKGRTTRSSMLSSTNLSWHTQVGGANVSGRFAGSRDDSFLEERDYRSRVSHAYVDVEGAAGRHRARFGRQRLSGSGVLGYFDGVHYQYALNGGEQAIRAVAGAPVRSTRSGFDPNRRFGGLAVDLNTRDDRWYLSLYGLEQVFEGKTDRRALGAEARYHGDQVTGYSLVDYDVYFDQLNMLRLMGNWRMSESTVASVTVDHRRSPGLSLSNALRAEPGADDFDDLGPEFDDADLQRLALDRSLVYRATYASITRRLNPRWEVLFDAGLSSLRNEGAAWPGADIDSDDWHFHAQLVGRGLLQPSDTYSLGIRYLDAERFDRTSLLFRSRMRLGERWRLSPRLRIDYRQRDDGTTNWQLWPSIRASYEYSRQASLELDTGIEFTSTDFVLDDRRDDSYFYLRAGYRRDF